MKFVSFAALSLTYAEAVKISRDFDSAQQKLADLQAKGPPDLRNVMQSLNSLEKAYSHHESEKSLLNSINKELNQFWDEVDDTKRYVKIDEKSAAKEKTKEAEKSEEKEEIFSLAS